MYDLFKKIAFSMDPEAAHVLALKFLSKFPSISSKLFSRNDALDFSKFSVKVGDMTWKTPIGLAAGLDKNGEAIDFFTRIPFGAVEVGTVTPNPQKGNTKPRLFRLEEEKSLRNSMGFNNRGSFELKEKLIRSNRHGKPIGVNLGKNKDTHQEEAYLDYQRLYDRFSGTADYLVINVSSPNTPGLRDLGKRNAMQIIFESLSEQRINNPCPLFLKLSPDMASEDLEDILLICHRYKLDGVIATNTTIMPELGVGGVSGQLLKQKAKDFRVKVLSFIRKNNLELEVIGVGGVDCFADLLEFWEQGGKVMQIYSSFIYQGPEVLLNILHGINEYLHQNNLNSVQDFLESRS